MEKHLQVWALKDKAHDLAIAVYIQLYQLGA